MAELTPVTELPTYGDIDAHNLLDWNLPPVIWDYQLPPTVDAERLQLNVTALKRYHRVGAITTSIITQYEGDTTQFTPGIGGLSADGTAIASRTGVYIPADKSDPSVIDRLDMPSFMRSSFGRPIITHRLNRPELANAVTDTMQKGRTTREQAWADALNDALQDSFRRSGKEHLLNRCIKPLRYFDYAAYTVWGGSVAGTIALNDTVPVLGIGIWAGWHGLFTAFQAYSNKSVTGHHSIDEKRWSIFYGNQQSDRYLALNALIRVSDLIKVRG